MPTYIEDKSFPRIDGTERKLSEIINEIITQMYEAQWNNETVVDSIYEGGENYFQIMAQGNLKYDVEYQLEMYNQTHYLQSMTGGALEDYGARYNLFKIDPVQAFGNVVFSIPAATVFTIMIYDGTIVRTNDNVVFQVVKGGVIEAGQLNITLTVVCLEYGTVGNVRKGSIRFIDTPSSTDLRVTNEFDFTTGVDRESDDEFKAEILASHDSYTVGTPSWFVVASNRIVDSSIFVFTNRKERQATIYFKLRSGQSIDKALADLTTFFSDLRNDVVLIDLSFKEGSPVRVVKESSKITLMIDSHYAWSTVSGHSRIAGDEYIESLGIHDNFYKETFLNSLLSVDGVLEVKLSEDIVDKKMNYDEFAITSNYEIIREKSS
jgi:phage-related baseplate assembly protein